MKMRWLGLAFLIAIASTVPWISSNDVLSRLIEAYPMYRDHLRESSLKTFVTVTDDNPRGEDAQAVRAGVLSGCPEALEIGDRARAIEAALNDLDAGDVLVVAGKGHEQGQTIGGVVYPFDDVSVIRGLVGVLS